VDDRIARWKTCPAKENPTKEKRSTFAVDVPRSTAAVGIHTVAPKAHRIFRHRILVAARVENILMLCQAEGPKAAEPTRVAKGCLTDMASAIAYLERPATHAQPLATRVLLSGMDVPDLALINAPTNSTPCPKNDRSFLAKGSPGVRLTQTKGSGDNRYTADRADVWVERLASSAAAQAKVAALTKLIRTCTGRFTADPQTEFPLPGVVDSVRPAKVGDGGVAISYRTTPLGGTAPKAPGFELAFSTGPYAVHVHGHGSRQDVRRNALAAAQALIKRVAATS
jgi:hypothetical protein